MKRLHESLPEVVANLRLDAASPLQRAKLVWPGVCGPQVAGVTEPLRVEGRLLVVGVFGRDWREALFEQRGRLIGLLRAQVPDFAGIRFETLAAPPEVARVGGGRELAPGGAAPARADPRNADVAHAGLRAELDALYWAMAQQAPRGVDT